MVTSPVPVAGDCGFESHRGHGLLSVVSVVCCQVEVSATNWSLVRRSPTDWRVVVCDLEISKEEAKARYRAVSTNPQWVVTPREREKKGGHIRDRINRTCATRGWDEEFLEHCTRPLNCVHTNSLSINRWRRRVAQVGTQYVLMSSRQDF